MNYELILNQLRPSKEEVDAVKKITGDIINFINETCIKEGINAKAMVVGSVAKNTWISGNSDIDIFIHFPTTTDMDYLKTKGMELAYKTNDAFNGKANKHFASHPYLTSNIDGFEVDIVPCYEIGEGESIISAVDRTILHTRYIQKHLNGRDDEVLLLKRFMDSIGTYGSEFKTGGFAGYLCELLILHYDTFENTLRQAQNWKFNTKIDLEGYGTADNKIFKEDPLVFIDPTDKNRNVAAALRIERFVDFIVASRNFLDIVDSNDLSDEEKENKVLEFFNHLEKEHLNKSNEEIAYDIIESFKDRETQTLVIRFPIGEEIPNDVLHPQLLKTIESICEKLEAEEFSVFKFAYWTDEEKFVIFTIELNVFKQGKYYIHKGPKVWPKKACDNFKAKWGDALYPLDEFMVLTREREFKTARDFIEHTLDEKNIHIIKVGKNIKGNICNEKEIFEIDEFLNDLNGHFNYDIDTMDSEELAFDYLNSLDDFLNPGQYIKR